MFICVGFAIVSDKDSIYRLKFPHGSSQHNFSRGKVHEIIIVTLQTGDNYNSHPPLNLSAVEANSLTISMPISILAGRNDYPQKPVWSAA